MNATHCDGGRVCLCCTNTHPGHRYACHTCTDDMRRWLADMEDYTAIILSTLEPVRSPNTGSIGTAFGSRTPIRLDALTLLDYRSGAGAAVHRLRDPRDMDDTPIRSLPGGIHHLAQWLREEADQSEPKIWTLVSELRYLRTRVEGCAMHSWVDEVYSDLKELHDQSRRVARVSSPPIGHCMEVGCGGAVYWQLGEVGGVRLHQAKCSDRDCNRIYSGTDLVRLGAQEAG